MSKSKLSMAVWIPPWHSSMRLMPTLLLILSLIALTTFYVSPGILPSSDYSLASSDHIDIAGASLPKGPSSFHSIGSRPKTPKPAATPAPPATPERHDMCVATRVHEEAHNIMEWIEYHHIMGFTKFFVFDDCSKDETMDVLLRYAGLGLVHPMTHQNCTPDRKPYEQGLIDAAFQAARKECEWVAVFDVDEYITQQTDLHNGTLLEWAQSLDPKWPCMRMMWQFMSNDGIIFPPNKLIVDTYIHGDYRPVHLKSFIKAETVAEWAYSLFPTVYAEGYEHLSSRLNAESLPTDTRVVNEVNLPTEPFFLNHYITKSLTEFLAVRGGRQQTSNGDHSPWGDRPMEFWNEYQYKTVAIGREWTKGMGRKTAEALKARPWPRISHARFYFGPEPMGLDEGWMDGRTDVQVSESPPSGESSPE